MSKGKLMDNIMKESKLGGVSVTIGTKGKLIVIKTAKPITRLELSIGQVGQLITRLHELAFPQSETFIWEGIDETENL